MTSTLFEQTGLEHKWAYGYKFNSQIDSSKFNVYLCSNCNAILYHWYKIVNGKIEHGSYIMNGNTQYSVVGPNTFKCTISFY